MTAYARAVHAGQRADFPPLDSTEIGAMGRALQKMQTALEGKAYVERYVQQNVRLCIENTGSAIPDYALDKLFEKFYSLKRPDSGRKSTGLGRNLVKQVAILQNGTIALKNRPSGGVQAILTLPLLTQAPKLKQTQ